MSSDIYDRFAKLELVTHLERTSFNLHTINAVVLLSPDANALTVTWLGQTLVRPAAACIFFGENQVKIGILYIKGTDWPHRCLWSGLFRSPGLPLWWEPVWMRLSAAEPLSHPVSSQYISQSSQWSLQKPDQVLVSLDRFLMQKWLWVQVKIFTFRWMWF